jgi:hypothetical protein
MASEHGQRQDHAGGVGVLDLPETERTTPIDRWVNSVVGYSLLPFGVLGPTCDIRLDDPVFTRHEHRRQVYVEQGAVSGSLEANQVERVPSGQVRPLVRSSYHAKESREALPVAIGAGVS